MKDIQDYYDIITREHHISKNRKRMSLTERAAQFAPFAALTGFDDAIEETGRVTMERIENEEVTREPVEE
mgnify:CR=1 FL=1